MIPLASFDRTYRDGPPPPRPWWARLLAALAALE